MQKLRPLHQCGRWPSGESKIMTNRSSGRLRDEYDGGKFVGRKEAITQAEQWRHSEKRLLTITGIPGIGKTWLVNYLVQLWDAEPNTFVKHLDLQPYINTHQIDQPQEPFGESDEFFNAARQFIEQCDVGVIYESTNELAVAIGQVAERLCEKHAQGHLIYLFLDGADDLSAEEWGTLEAHLIEPLCRCEEIRFVISLRESQRIQSFPLRSQEERLELPPLANIEGREQLQRRGISGAELGKLDKLIENGYQLEHPGINSFLAIKILREKIDFTGEYITEPFVQELLIALDTVPIHHPDDVKHAIDLLLNLAQLTDQWSFQIYRNHRQLSISKGWEEIDFLQQHHLILFVPDSAQLYRVAPGILPFLRLVRTGNA